MSAPKTYNLATVITFNNKTQTIREWATELGLNHDAIRHRLQKYGWPPERALSTAIRGRAVPTFKGGSQEVAITFNNKTQSLREWAIELGISNDTLRNRLYKLKWPPSRALTYRTQQSHGKNTNKGMLL